MSSDSELSDVPQDDSKIEQTLRDIVKSGNVDPVTVNGVRAAAEEQLGLPEGFFKSAAWKNKSKDVIAEAFDAPPSPVKLSKASKGNRLAAASKPKAATASSSSALKGKHTAATKQESAASKPRPSSKRASTEGASNPKKRQKRAATESDLSDVPTPDSDESEAEKPSLKRQAAKKKAEKAEKPKESRRRQQVADDEDESESDVTHNANKHHNDAESVEGLQADRQGKKETKGADLSESELSEVIDEPPQKKKRQKSASIDSRPKAKATKVTKSSASTAKDVTPDEAEMKRLQGWLLKCGIRKLWHRELAPYGTPKAKIEHLKDMLKDAGMDGRYSVEKASTIKEQRELAADLEAVKEGAKKWGHGSDEEDEEQEDGGARPRRRAAAAAARFVDFGDSGEESD
ncbi:hypothetical protein MBLNU459_g1797t1 [Dothideomycetes sp. NU459]